MSFKTNLVADDDYEYIGNGVYQAKVYDGENNLVAYIYKTEDESESIDDVFKRIHKNIPYQNPFKSCDI